MLPKLIIVWRDVVYTVIIYYSLFLIFEIQLQNKEEKSQIDT
jgi:hypothetical protein